MRGRGAAAVLLSLAASTLGGDVDPASPPTAAPITACEGRRPPLPPSLLYELRAGAFPGSGRADVAVHVPPGFDATRRPGMVVYFHGWNGCVEAALADEDTPCSEGGESRAAGHLAARMDEARVNAVLVAVELRADQPTGEPGQLATYGGLRALLRELLDEHLDAALGGAEGPCPLELDAFDRVVVVAHSGGYQSAASVLARGDVPQITEVVLLDALYGADEVFASWVRDAVERFDASRRFVDLYTCCAGTLERSQALASMASRMRGGASLVLDDGAEDACDGDRGPAVADPDDPWRSALNGALVFQRVCCGHADVPQVYLSAILQYAGLAPLQR